MKTDGWKPTCLHSSVDSLVERVISWIRRVFTAGFRIIRRVKYTEFVPPFFIRPFNRSMLKTSSIDFDSSSSFFLFFFSFRTKRKKNYEKIIGKEIDLPFRCSIVSRDRESRNRRKEIDWEREPWTTRFTIIFWKDLTNSVHACSYRSCQSGITERNEVTEWKPGHSGQEFGTGGLVVAWGERIW